MLQLEELSDDDDDDDDDWFFARIHKRSDIFNRFYFFEKQENQI